MNSNVMENLIISARDGLEQAEEAARVAKMAGIQGARELEHVLKMVEVVQNKFWIRQLENRTFDKRIRHDYEAPLLIESSGFILSRLEKKAKDDVICGMTKPDASQIRRRHHSESEVNPIPKMLRRYNDLLS